jgi:hypothetical protein
MDWEQEGRDLGATFDEHHAVVVLGSDANATARVALGIGRAQAQHRRVAIGDLLGDAPPLQSLIGADDPHGIVDSFMYGVSLNRIAYPVADAGELFIMPSGTSPIDYEDLFLNPRWRRLIAGFREVGALLVLVAPANAPHLRAIVGETDGAVIVGDEVPGELAVAQSLAWLRPRRHAPITLAAPAADVGEPVVATVPEPSPRRNTLIAAAAGLLLTVLLGGAGFWFARRPFAATPKPRVGVAADSPKAQSVTAGTLAPDSVMRVRQAERDSIVRDSAARAASLAVLPDSFPVLAPANPQDSATASAFSVVLENTNGLAGAILDLRGRYASVPAGSYSLDARTRYYQLTAGAYQTRAGADSLLADLRARRVLAPGFGTIASLPFAFLAQADVPATEVPAKLARAAARAQPVYALRQPGGTAHLYFGAYDSPQQASLAVPAVRKAGLAPTLVYRIGRVF